MGKHKADAAPPVGEGTRRSVLAASLLVVATLGHAPAVADEGLVYVSGPGSVRLTYLPPVAVARADAPLTYMNLDTDLHDVIAVDDYAAVQCPGQPGLCPEGTPSWCYPPDPNEPWHPFTNPLPFDPGQCPLFWSDLIGLGQNTPVLGIEHLEPGETYRFTCSIHPFMTATLVALPEA